jgi:hypothetical protein
MEGTDVLNMGTAHSALFPRRPCFRADAFGWTGDGESPARRPTPVGGLFSYLAAEDDDNNNNNNDGDV